MAAAGENGDGLVGEVNLDAVAVELDLVNPPLPGGHLSIWDARAGSTKPGKGALTPVPTTPLTLRRHRTTPRNTYSGTNSDGRIRSGTTARKRRVREPY